MTSARNSRATRAKRMAKNCGNAKIRESYKKAWF